MASKYPRKTTTYYEMFYSFCAGWYLSYLSTGLLLFMKSTQLKYINRYINTQHINF